MKHILLFGAGKSATVLIDYLKSLSTERSWQVTVADSNKDVLMLKVGTHAFVSWVELQIEDAEQRINLVAKADVVISMLPPSLHYHVALDCINHTKHLLTASYIDDKVRDLEPQINQKQLLFLCEMGLDPGIDHMSAMELINKIRGKGGVITSFKSHCGGLIAPESDDNPWHYKISWNPRNVVMAGKAGAIYKEDGQEVTLDYQQLFAMPGVLPVPGLDTMAFYPNRNSLGYIPVYGLEQAATFMRTTIRHPDFCFGWNNIISLKLTDESDIYETDGMTFSDFFRIHFEKHGFSQWITDMLSTRLSFAKDLMKNLMQLIDEQPEENEEPEAEESIMLVNENGELDTIGIGDVRDRTAEAVALKMHEANLSLKQLFFLGLDSDQLINNGNCTAAEILQLILQQKLALQPNDKDMIVMLHEVKYELENRAHVVQSHLVCKGENSERTAMAKTVGLPLGIAAKLILDGVITQTGLHIPVGEHIYKPVLAELRKHGIVFTETKGTA
ncbi:saccharopine dehydrogenase [Segetibacter sp. 3557_3]|uniref:saccharopine dehydrogenase C-terminal domain-containing protein n=1 Tax=Segetibacter sp. 3557_3 TaxID=2547429 RepID=UPI001058E619|nr:saccharopine dehydrogenase C-terminal domain-containing protein [Segetibacter sp. 3557_3]TDH28892.1 saccharopine dehydrogenase [Segetibacter sp. 3557_3]